MSEFVVINIENIDNDFNSSRAAIKQKFRQVSVELARKEDFGVNDNTVIVNTHLGDILNFNDTVLGYDLTQASLSDIDKFNSKDLQLPDVVLVKKTYPKFRKRQRNRIWKLKHFEDQEMQNAPEEEDNEMEGQDDGDSENGGDKAQPQKKTKRIKKKRLRKMARQQDHVHGASKKDYNLFLQDLEEDPELRQQVNLYPDEDVMKDLEARIGGMTLDDEKRTSNRIIKKAVRKTAEGKESAIKAEKQRQKN